MGDREGSKSADDETAERRLVIINRPYISMEKRCDRCAEPSGMITPDEAAAICDVSTRTVYRWLETSEIHFSETADGLLLICLSSLAATAMNEAQAEPEG